MARHSKVGTIDLEQVGKLTRKGWTDAELADFYKVSQQTIDNWKKQSPEFFGSLKEGKAVADERVERALFERATGYSHPEDKIFMHEGCPIVVPTTKHYPPDSTAMIFWLKNRKPEEWREKTQNEVTIPGLSEFFASLPQNYGLPKQ